MAADRRPELKPRRVFIHPEFARALGHRAADQGGSLQSHLHVILCDHFGRPDLAGIKILSTKDARLVSA